MISISKPPKAQNEGIKSYSPGTEDRQRLEETIKKLKEKETVIPMIIGGKAISTGVMEKIRAPHDHSHLLGRYHQGEGSHVRLAIEESLKAREQWANTPWEQRAAIFLKAASLLSGPFREKINATTMLGQSNNVFQAEIDAAGESIDFLNYNVE